MYNKYSSITFQHFFFVRLSLAYEVDSRVSLIFFSNFLITYYIFHHNQKLHVTKNNYLKIIKKQWRKTAKNAKNCTVY